MGNHFFDLIMEGYTAERLGVSQEEFESFLKAMRNKGMEPPFPVVKPPRPQPKTWPKGTEMMKNAFGAVGDIYKHGVKLVPEEERNRRLDICEACEYFDEMKRRCRYCGCWVDFKSTLEAWHCPIKKW